MNTGRKQTFWDPGPQQLFQSMLEVCRVIREDIRYTRAMQLHVQLTLRRTRRHTMQTASLM